MPLDLNISDHACMPADISWKKILKVDICSSRRAEVSTEHVLLPTSVAATHCVHFREEQKVTTKRIY